jgi:hypothetical protein
MNRNRFLLSSASTAALAACSPSGVAMEPRSFASSLQIGIAKPARFTRLEIREFSKNPTLVAAFRRDQSDAHDRRCSQCRQL